METRIEMFTRLIEEELLPTVLKARFDAYIKEKKIGVIPKVDFSSLFATSYMMVNPFSFVWHHELDGIEELKYSLVNDPSYNTLLLIDYRKIDDLNDCTLPLDNYYDVINDFPMIEFNKEENSSCQKVVLLILENWFSNETFKMEPLEEIMKNILEIHPISPENSNMINSINSLVMGYKGINQIAAFIVELA